MSIRFIDGQLWLDTARIESVSIVDQGRGNGVRTVRIIMQSGTIHDCHVHHPQGGTAPAAEPDQLAADWIADHLHLDRRHP